MGGLLAAAALTAAATASASAATDPAPTATPTISYALTSSNPSMWTVSRDGSTIAITTSTERRNGGADNTIEVVDLRTKKSTVFPIANSQYSPPDASLSADGHLLSWTTATSRKGPKRAYFKGLKKKRTRIWDPTTWVRDLTTGAVRSFPHYDGNLEQGDGSFIYAGKGPIIRWGDPGAGIELPAASGILQLATGQFVAIPGHAKYPLALPVVGDVTPSGSKVAYVFGGKCRVLTVATGAVTALGTCAPFDDLSLAADGSTAFSSALGGWRDAGTGAALGTALDVSPFSSKGSRAYVYGRGKDDLSQIVVVCNPGSNPKNLDSVFTSKRRTYLLDRTTRLYSPLVGPTEPLSSGVGAFMTGVILPTADGDELFWGTDSYVYRAATTPTAAAGPLPKDCQPA